MKEKVDITEKRHSLHNISSKSCNYYWPSVIVDYQRLAMEHPYEKMKENVIIENADFCYVSLVLIGSLDL